MRRWNQSSCLAASPLASSAVGHRDAERLDELAVLHAGGAGRFAGAAVEAELEVAFDAGESSSRPSVTARIR